MLDTSTTLWIAQIFLALFFFAAGLPKVFGRGLDRWVGFDRIPRPMTVLIGLCEVAAAVGLVVPMLVDELVDHPPRRDGTGRSVGHGGRLPPPRAGVPARHRDDAVGLAGHRGRHRPLGRALTGPTISTDVLVPVVGCLVLAILVNLVILFRQPVPAG